MFTEESDHLGVGLERLPEYLKEQANLETLIGVFMEPFQELESVLVQFRDERSIANGAGAQLDRLGEYLNITRGLDTDSQFRARLRARVLELNRAGQAQVVIDAYKALTGADSVTLTQIYPLTFEIVANVSTPIVDEAAALSAIWNVKALGIQMSAEVADTGSSFLFSADEASANPRGLATTTGETDGGTLNKVLAYV